MTASLPYSVVAGVVTPHWLTPRLTCDLRWLLHLYNVAIGQPYARLGYSVQQHEWTALDSSALALVRRVLDRAFTTRPPGGPKPSALRLEAYEARAAGHSRPAALAAVGANHGLTAQAVESLLFADLAPARLLEAPPVEPTVSELIERANLELVQGLVRRAERLRAEFRGDARNVARALRATRLIADVSGDNPPDFQLDVSGPLTLHRRTTVYGKALARFIPALAACERWRLRADLLLPEGAGSLEVGHGDAILRRGAPSSGYDSQVEERLHREFARHTDTWVLHREPGPVRRGATWIFPDFLAVSSAHPNEAVWVEIIGFWTPAHLARKLRAVNEAVRAGGRRWILCVDESLALENEPVPPTATVLRFRKRVRPDALLRLLSDRG